MITHHPQYIPVEEYKHLLLTEKENEFVFHLASVFVDHMKENIRALREEHTKLTKTEDPEHVEAAHRLYAPLYENFSGQIRQARYLQFKLQGLEGEELTDAKFLSELEVKELRHAANR